MLLTKIYVKNYRLLVDAWMDVDSSMTLIVGRNNTAKTSCMDIIEKVLKGSVLSYDDYPICKRKQLFDLITQYMKKDISYAELNEKLQVTSVEFTIDKNTMFYDELVGLYEKYCIILNLNEKYISDTLNVEKLLNEIEKINMLELDYKELIDKIENKDSYKKELKSFLSDFDKQKRKINFLSNKIKIKELKSKYNTFPAEIQYTNYTGIDKKYFEDIK